MLTFRTVSFSAFGIGLLCFFLLFLFILNSNVHASLTLNRPHAAQCSIIYGNGSKIEKSGQVEKRSYSRMPQSLKLVYE